MHSRIPKSLRSQISSSNCQQLDSFTLKGETFGIGEDVILIFGEFPNFFKGRIHRIFYIKKVSDTLSRVKGRRIRKNKIKRNPKENILKSFKSGSSQNYQNKADVNEKLKKIHKGGNYENQENHAKKERFKNEDNSKKCLKRKSQMAVLVEIQFYRSVDDLPDIEEDFSSAKELFLSLKCHLVYAFNIISKCLVDKGMPQNNQDFDSFFSFREYDPINNCIRIKHQE